MFYGLRKNHFGPNGFLDKKSNLHPKDYAKNIVLNLGCGKQVYGDVRLDKYRGEANVLADIDVSLPFKDNVFTIVYSRFVFEHLRNPGLVIEEMKRILKPKGRLILITDNASYTPFYLTPFLGSGFHAGGYKGFGLDDKHYSIFTKEHIMHHMLSAGLESIIVNYVYANQIGGKDGIWQKTASFLGLHKLGMIESFCKANIYATGIKPLNHQPISLDN